MKSLPTWFWETLLVSLVMSAVVLISGNPLEGIGALAVLAAFAHAQVSDRMAEQQAAKAKPDTHCWRWSLRYFVAKELLWLAYFVAHGSWSALAGVGVFLLYPLWRKRWRARRPLRFLDDLSQVRFYLNGREFALVDRPSIQVGLPWSARLVLELRRVADDRDIDHMVRMGDHLHAFFAMPNGCNWVGKAVITRLRFFDDTGRPGLQFASLELMGSGGLQNV